MSDTVIQLAEQFKTALAKQDLAAERRLINAYRGLWATIREKADALILEIGTLENATPAQVQRLKRYGALMEDIRQELGRFGTYARVEMTTAAREAIRMGEGNARILTAAQLGNAQLASQLNRLNPEAIERLLGFLSPTGNLFKRLDKLSGWTAQQVADAILEGVALGKGPRATAKLLSKTLMDGVTQHMGMALTDSLRMMRTVQLYSYREANRASYIANDDVVKGWIWFADVAKACPACMAMHGTIHEHSEVLDDHHNGGCLVPETLVSGLNPYAVVSRHYDGEIITIRTTSGKLLTVTPNHPILTDHGWVAANLLKHGDNVISYSGRDWTAFGMDPNEYLMPTRVKDVFSANWMDGFTSVPTAAEDFHGDGIGSNVHVIRTHRLLLDKNNPAIRKPGTQKVFSGGYVSKDTLARFGDFRSVERSMFMTPYGVLCLPDSAQLFFTGHTSCVNLSGGDLPTRSNSRSDQARINGSSGNAKGDSQTIDTFASIETLDNIANWKGKLVASDFTGFLASNGIPDGFTSKQPIDLEVIRQSLLARVPPGSADLNAITSEIVLDGIVEINTTSFRGHVYNLQTETEWYIANGIITHNCAMLPLVIGAKNDIPSGESVFRELSEAEQKQRMGPEKWQAWQDGKFDFSQLSTTHTDDVYGEMRSVTSLKDLIGSD